MKYINITEGIFIDRPNRFIANVLLDSRLEKVHVRNTGRCSEILKKGTKVYLEKSNNPNRKTKYSLISAFKGNSLINIDSQIPNKVVYSSIQSGQINEIPRVDLLQREVTYGNSRFDLYYESKDQKGFIEVKGVTLEANGTAMFPDAPTERGTKHVHEIIQAQKEGYENYIFFLIQMSNINYFKPNHEMDSKFSTALSQARNSKVKILAYNSIITKNQISLSQKVKVLI